MSSRSQAKSLHVKAGQVDSHDSARPAVGELVDQLPLRIERAQVDDVGAGPEHAKECDRVPGRVRHIERDRMAAIDSDMPESCRRARGLVTQPAVADASALIFKSRPIAV